MKITDAHVHYSPQTGGEFLTRFLDRTGTDAAVIQAVSHSRCISLIPGALKMKDQAPERFYVFGSPDFTEYYLHPETLGEYLVEYLELILEAGCDGVKLLEGKPQMRKSLPVPDFDLDCWEPFWAYVEKNAVPVLWHVNDPESHWRPDASEWVKKQGWWYDETFINNEVQYTQVLNVLKKHPKLRIVFAHFFFLSARLQRLDGILEQYPNVMVDLTPGIEMYENFSNNQEAASAFFAKYHDRIAYGTDIGGRCILTNESESFNEAENILRPRIVQDFLTMKGEKQIISDGNFLHDREPFLMRGLALPEERLQEILGDNIRYLIGGEPKPVDPDKVLELCAYLREKMIAMTEIDPEFRPDVSQIENAERWFCRKIYG